MPNTTPVIHTTAKQRKQFDCGIHPLNDFLRRHSNQNHLVGFGRTYVLVIDEKIIGYYTVSMSNSVEFVSVKSESIEFPKYPIPVGLIGRLAVSKDNQKQGWGKWLLIDAVRRIYDAAQEVGAHAVLVDAKDESAENFYKQYGFSPFPSKPSSLYIPLDSVAGLMASDQYSWTSKN